jgi:DnaJ-class molecular chaperone
MSDPTSATTSVSLTKAERHIIETALQANGCGFALEIAARLRETRCPACSGSGHAPYVGGDDDALCARCDGSGHDARAATT